MRSIHLILQAAAGPVRPERFPGVALDWLEGPFGARVGSPFQGWVMGGRRALGAFARAGAPPQLRFGPGPFGVVRECPSSRVFSRSAAGPRLTLNALVVAPGRPLVISVSA